MAKTPGRPDHDDDLVVVTGGRFRGVAPLARRRSLAPGDRVLVYMRFRGRERPAWLVVTGSSNRGAVFGRSEWGRYVRFGPKHVHQVETGPDRAGWPRSRTRDDGGRPAGPDAVTVVAAAGAAALLLGGAYWYYRSRQRRAALATTATPPG
jgi:hypothetical protein